jgi:hypothetical protein
MSLRNLTKYYRLTMDSSISNSITLHKADGSSFVFTPSDNGLYRIPLSHLRDGATSHVVPCGVHRPRSCSRLHPSRRSSSTTRSYNAKHHHASWRSPNGHVRNSILEELPRDGTSRSYRHRHFWPQSR